MGPSPQKYLVLKTIRKVSIYTGAAELPNTPEFVLKKCIALYPHILKIFLMKVLSLVTHTFIVFFKEVQSSLDACLSLISLDRGMSRELSCGECVDDKINET